MSQAVELTHVKAGMLPSFKISKSHRLDLSSNCVMKIRTFRLIALRSSLFEGRRRDSRQGSASRRLIRMTFGVLPPTPGFGKDGLDCLFDVQVGSAEICRVSGWSRW